TPVRASVQTRPWCNRYLGVARKQIHSGRTRITDRNMRGPPSRVLIGLSRPARLPMARPASNARIRIRAYFAAAFGYPQSRLHRHPRSTRMSTYPNDSVAQADFEQASNRANELAERISHCGRSGAPRAVMLELLKAWKLARHEARN